MNFNPKTNPTFFWIYVSIPKTYRFKVLIFFFLYKKTLNPWYDYLIRFHSNEETRLYIWHLSIFKYFIKELFKIWLKSQLFLIDHLK